jgi:hypothetical protein
MSPSPVPKCEGPGAPSLWFGKANGTRGARLSKFFGTLLGNIQGQSRLECRRGVWYSKPDQHQLVSVLPFTEDISVPSAFRVFKVLHRRLVTAVALWSFREELVLVPPNEFLVVPLNVEQAVAMGYMPCDQLPFSIYSLRRCQSARLDSSPLIGRISKCCPLPQPDTMVLGFAAPNRPSPAARPPSDVNHFFRSLRVEMNINVVRRVRLHTQAVVLTHPSNTLIHGTNSTVLPDESFLFQLPNPLLQELRLRFLLGQRQRQLARSTTVKNCS